MPATLRAMETLFLLTSAALGEHLPAVMRGQALPLSHQQQQEVLYLKRSGRVIEAIRLVRGYKQASLRDAVTTVKSLSAPLGILNI